jgi:hypothetical protein
VPNPLHLVPNTVWKRGHEDALPVRAMPAPAPLLHPQRGSSPLAPARTHDPMRQPTPTVHRGGLGRHIIESERCLLKPQEPPSALALDVGRSQIAA